MDFKSKIIVKDDRTCKKFLDAVCDCIVSIYYDWNPPNLQSMIKMKGLMAHQMLAIVKDLEKKGYGLHPVIVDFLEELGCRRLGHKNICVLDLANACHSNCALCKFNIYFILPIKTAQTKERREREAYELLPETTNNAHLTNCPTDTECSDKK